MKKIVLSLFLLCSINLFAQTRDSFVNDSLKVLYLQDSTITTLDLTYLGLTFSISAALTFASSIIF